MRKRLAYRVEAALPGLDSARASDVRRRVARLVADCGCAMGGVFLWGALLLLAPFLVVIRGATPVVLLAAAALVLVGAGVGKALGIAVATVRLQVLVHRVTSASGSERRQSHVDVH
jgi:VIT1/CCC1 family predicted Fe2+/Mn2+ transporter